MTETIATNDFVFWGLLIAQLVSVVLLSTRAVRLPPTATLLLLAFYATSVAAILPIALRVFTARSIAATFLMTCGMFAGLAAYGAGARLRVAAFGQLLFMGLVALVMVLTVTLLWPGDML